MLIQKNTINQLRDFGLNSYESKLWTALLSRGTATAGELSDITNVPRSRAYDVLESLEKKGFIIMKIGKPIKYLAVDPDHVLERVRKKVLEDAEIQTEIINKFEGSELLNELKLLHKTGVKKVDTDDLSGLFKGKKNIYHNIDKKIKAAQKYVLIQTTESGIFSELALKSAIRKAKERGVKVLIAAPITTKNQSAVSQLVAFAEIKNTTTSGRFYIFDDEDVVLMPKNDTDVHQAYDSAVWVKSPAFASSLKKMFLVMWAELKKAQME